MRNSFICFIFFIANFASAGELGNFTILSVGASNNTDSVYIETVESIPGTTCGNTKVFRLPDSDKNADRFFSLALAAQAQNKKITIAYEIDQCIQGSTLAKVFKLFK